MFKKKVSVLKERSVQGQVLQNMAKMGRGRAAQDHSGESGKTGCGKPSHTGARSHRVVSPGAWS